jgi:hypothetical protein
MGCREGYKATGAGRLAIADAENSANVSRCSMVLAERCVAETKKRCVYQNFQCVIICVLTGNRTAPIMYSSSGIDGQREQDERRTGTYNGRGSVSCQTQISDTDRERQAHGAGDDTGYLGVVGRIKASDGGAEGKLEMRSRCNRTIRMTHAPLA